MIITLSLFLDFVFFILDNLINCDGFIRKAFSLFEDVQKHFDYFLSHKWERPGEDVHEVGQDVGVRSVVELLDVQGVALNSHY